MYDENCADEMTRKKERKKKVKMKQSSNKRESHGQKTTFHFLHEKRHEACANNTNQNAMRAKANVLKNFNEHVVIILPNIIKMIDSWPLPYGSPNQCHQSKTNDSHMKHTQLQQQRQQRQQQRQRQRTFI